MSIAYITYWFLWDLEMITFRTYFHIVLIIFGLNIHMAVIMNPHVPLINPPPNFYVSNRHSEFLYQHTSHIIVHQCWIMYIPPAYVTSLVNVYPTFPLAWSMWLISSKLAKAIDCKSPCKKRWKIHMAYSLNPINNGSLVLAMDVP